MNQSRSVTIILADVDPTAAVSRHYRQPKILTPLSPKNVGRAAESAAIEERSRRRRRRRHFCGMLDFSTHV